MHFNYINIRTCVSSFHDFNPTPEQSLAGRILKQIVVGSRRLPAAIPSVIIMGLLKYLTTPSIIHRDFPVGSHHSLKNERVVFKVIVGGDNVRNQYHRYHDLRAAIRTAARTYPNRSARYAPRLIAHLQPVVSRLPYFIGSGSGAVRPYISTARRLLIWPQCQQRPGFAKHRISPQDHQWGNCCNYLYRIAAGATLGRRQLQDIAPG